MAVYLVGHISVKNYELWQQYVAGVQESLTHFDSKVLFRGQLVEVLTGLHDYDTVVVIEFADQATMDQWYRSKHYQALIPIRDKAADVSIMSYTA